MVATSGGIVAGVDLGFGGEVAEFYHRYRHGDPEPVTDAIADAFGLSARDLVVDLGCGTGQLTLPISRRVRAVVGMDPEPDMLRRARQAARDAGISNVSWMVSADTDLPEVQPVRREVDRRGDYRAGLALDEARGTARG